MLISQWSTISGFIQIEKEGGMGVVNGGGRDKL